MANNSGKRGFASASLRQALRFDTAQTAAAPEATVARMRFAVGDRVEAGESAEEYDTGRIILIEGAEITVAWDGGARTTQPPELLRPAGERPIPRPGDL